MFPIEQMRTCTFIHIHTSTHPQGRQPLERCVLGMKGISTKTKMALKEHNMQCLSFQRMWLWLVYSCLHAHTFPAQFWKPRVSVSPSFRDPQDSTHPLGSCFPPLPLPGQELFQAASTEICPAGLTRRFFIRPCPLMSRKCPCPIPNCEVNVFLASGPLPEPLPLMVDRHLPIAGVVEPSPQNPYPPALRSRILENLSCNKTTVLSVTPGWPR